MKLEFIEYNLELSNFEYELDKVTRVIIAKVMNGGQFFSNLNKVIYKVNSAINIRMVDINYHYFTNGRVSINYNSQQDELKLTIRYDQLMVSDCEINIFNLYINKVEYKIEYMNCRQFSELEDSVGKDIKFKQGEYSFKIQNNYSPRYYTISVESIGKIEYNELIRKCDELYQLFSFSLGQYFDVNNIKIYIDKIEVYYYRRLNDIYNYKTIDMYSNFILVNLKEDLSNKYLKWLEFKDKTNLINNVYLTSINQSEFRDLALSKMINLLDGFTRIVKSKELREKIAEFRSENPKKKYGMRNRYRDIILENEVVANMKNSKKIHDLLDKIVYHRNYFSHFYQRGNPFNKYEMDFTLNILNLIYRLEVLKYLGWEINIEQLQKNIEKIEK